MEKEENKKRILQNIGIVALSIVIIGLLALCIYMFFIKKDGSDIDNNDNQNNTEIKLDYDKLKDELMDEINNKTAYLESCDCSKVIDYDSADDAKCVKESISIDTITTFINKLKSADKVELVSTSTPCSEYTYSVLTNDTNERLLVAYAGNDTSILLVGIKDKGYAFHFTSENINQFLSSLDDNNVDNDNNRPVSYSKIDETKGTYYVIKGKSYDLYSHFENKYEKHDNEKISFDYPVININTNSVKKLNNDIKTMYDNLLKEIKNENDEYGCTCIKMENKYYCNEHIKEYSYGIYETTNFITININWNLHTDCAGGYSSDYLYTVSKRTGEVLNDKDIIDSLGYNRDKINKELPIYIQSLYHEDISSELENITNYLSFFPYDGKLVIGYEIIDGTEYVLYDGKNFKEVDYSTFNSIFKK